MSFREKIEDLFLSERNSFTKKRLLKTKNILIFTFFILFLVLMFGDSIERKKKQEKENTENFKVKITRPLLEYKTYEYDDIGVYKETVKAKKRIVSQIIAHKSDSLGLKVMVELVDKVEAISYNSIPIIAKALEGVLSFIEEGDLFLGEGFLDSESERLKINFHTHILNSGERKSISAQALSSNGTLGLKGEFNSQFIKKYGSRMTANFVGGMAKGLQKKEVTDQGFIFSSNGFQSAFLNGLSLVALDYARNKSKKNERIKAKMTLKKGIQFLIYFNRGSK